MKNAIALIQPSLYEGWSTLVEEAKALNQFIILSDIPVHREQIDQNADFFDPFNAAELAGKIICQLDKPQKIKQLDYKQNIVEFGEKIMEVFSNSSGVLINK